MAAKLVLYSPDLDLADTRFQRTVITHKQLGHNKERQTFDARRSIRNASQHTVNNVVGQVVLSTRDKNLGAGNVKAAVSKRGRPRGDLRQVTPTLRFREAP